MQKDLPSGIGWVVKAAESGEEEAQFFLGQAYRLGLTGAPDATKAAGWLERAADSGSARAAIALADMEMKRPASSRNLDSAQHWYLQAAERGDVEAYLALARAAANGSLGAQSLEEAYMWADLAVSVFPNRVHFDEALNLRRSLGDRISAEARNRAALAALKWLKKNMPHDYSVVKRISK